MAMREAFTVGIALTARDMYSSVMKKAERNLGILRKTSKDTADAFEKSLKRFQGLAIAGATVSVVSAQVSAKVQEVTRDAIEFSEAMGKIGTVIDVTGTKFESNRAALEAWRSKGLDVSTKSIYNATELLNDAAYDLMSSGLSADVAMDLLKSVSDTSMATIGDLNVTAKLFGRIMNTFGQGWDVSALEKGERIMNTLSGAVKKFQWTGDVLAESLAWATAAAKGANVEFEETVAALGMLNTKGWESSKAGMAIQTFIQEVSKGSKKLGISVTDASGQMLPLADILERIHAKFGDLNLAKQDKLVDAFGTRGAKLVQILYGEHDALRANTQALKDSGIATQMVESRMNSLDAQAKIIEHRWQNLRIELGDKAVPVMMTLKKGVIDLVDVLGEIPGAEAFAGTTLGVVGLVAEVGKTVGPVMTMVGVIGMWSTQAKIAAAAQAALNTQMGASAGAAGTQAMRMGMLGSRGTALVGVLGKVAAVGAAAFIGWEIGTLLRQIPGLDEAVQKLFATLTGAKIGTEVERDMTRASEVMNKLKKDFESVSEAEKKFFITYEWRMQKKAGRSFKEFAEMMKRFGLSEGEVRFYSGEKKTVSAVTPGESGRQFMSYQTGTKRVGRTGLAIIHEGEEIRPRSMTGKGIGADIAHEGEGITPKSIGGKETGSNVYFGDINIKLKSSGAAAMDARGIVDAVIREVNRRMKREARRL